jgi:hypothetical protein
MIQIIVDEWFELSMRFIEDLLMINDKNYWEMNDSNYCRWMIRIIHEIYWRFIDDKNYWEMNEKVDD